MKTNDTTFLKENKSCKMRDIVTKVKDQPEANQQCQPTNPRLNQSFVNNNKEKTQYTSYTKYLDGYNTLKYKPVKIDTLPVQQNAESVEVDGGSCEQEHEQRKQTHTHKAEILIQVTPQRECNKTINKMESIVIVPKNNHHHQEFTNVDNNIIHVVPPPPPPPAMSLDVMLQHKHKHPPLPPKPVELKTCLLDELKAKHPPKEYKHKVLDVRRTNDAIPINIEQVNVHSLKVAEQQRKFIANERNLLLHSITAPNIIKKHYPNKMLSNPDAHTETIIPVRADGTIDKNDPRVKKMVYSTLRNYVGAYNSQANSLAAQHKNVVQDKGVSEQIRNISLSGNLSHLNGRINPKQDD